MSNDPAAILRAFPVPPPVPALRSIVPTAWPAREGMAKDDWPSGGGFNLFVLGANFIEDESVVIVGSKVVVPIYISPFELQVWVQPPDKPATLPVRVRTGICISNPLPLAFLPEMPP